jgi:hypothetical protein
MSRPGAKAPARPPGRPFHTMATAAAPRPLRLPCAPPPGALAPELEAALAPDEAAPSFLSRTSADPVPTGLPLVGSLRPGEVLEFVGPSGCGKTALLVQVRDGRRGAGESAQLRGGPCVFCFLSFLTHALVSLPPFIHTGRCRHHPAG